ncbi:hypothetical protein G9A89_017633 [Geosiphon pyriformis]|nr:hypothetical protein G9A89_017633 [Geosiphon pyriformis]
MFNPVDKFQENYQQLCSTRQEQEQYLTQINTYLCEDCLIPCQNSFDSSESEKFVVYTNLEQEINIQYFDNRHLGIILKRAHPTDAKFDLHYLKDQSTTLPLRSITKIDLKIVVKIPPEIMVQIVSIQGGIIDSGYTENLMVLLQNNSEKSYIIEFKEKIAQAIFLLLVKVGKFVPVENRKKLTQTIKGIYGFRSTGKGIKANFIEMPGKK